MSQLRSMLRGVSPVLLVLAALCFLLPFVGVSCNTGAAQGVLGPAIQQLGGSGSQSGEAAQCLSALSNKDLVTYSGVNLAFGGKPSTATDIPGCTSTSTPGSQGSADQASLGVQPLVLVAFILIGVGVLATLLRAPLRHIVAAGAALVAVVLLIIDSTTVHSTFINKITSATAGAGSFSSLGVSADSFFNVHAALGFWLALAALILALLVNALGLIPIHERSTSGVPPGTAPPSPGWSDPSPPPQPPPGVPPPQ